MPLSSGRILIVDDETHVAAMLEEAVTHFGYDVRLAPTGHDAIHAVREFQPDVVLLDLTLPDASGEAVLEHLQQIHPEVPVIMVTGNIDIELAQRTLEQGAFDYIAKPFDLARLRQALEAAVAHRG